MSGLDSRRSNPVEQCSIAIASAVVIRGHGLHVWVVTRWRAANAVTARRSRGVHRRPSSPSVWMPLRRRDREAPRTHATRPALAFPWPHAHLGQLAVAGTMVTRRRLSSKTAVAARTALLEVWTTQEIDVPFGAVTWQLWWGARVERVVQLSSPGTSLAPTKSKISTETAAGLVPLLVTKHATFSTLSTTGVLSVMACAIVPETMSGRVSKLRRRIIW